MDMEKYFNLDKDIKIKMYGLLNEILDHSENKELEKADHKLKEFENYLIISFWINLYLAGIEDHERGLVAPIIERYLARKTTPIIE